MASLTIRIKSTAFDPGNPLSDASAFPQKVRISLGNSGSKGSDIAWALPVVYDNGAITADFATRGSLVITTSDAIIDRSNLASATQTIKNLLADYVTKGIVEVLDGGVPLAATDILTLN